jgi:hypothetical protein
MYTLSIVLILHFTAFIMAKRLLQTAFLLGELCLSIIAVCFPPPIGPYNTSIVTAELVDDNRLDPYASTPQPRALMVSIFHPVSPAACSLHEAPYMDPITAAFEDAEYADVGVLPGTFEDITLGICQQNIWSNLNPNRFVKLSTFPLVLFSPGMGNTRFIYSAMAQQCVFLAVTFYLLYILQKKLKFGSRRAPHSSTF